MFINSFPQSVREIGTSMHVETFDCVSQIAALTSQDCHTVPYRWIRGFVSKMAGPNFGKVGYSLMKLGAPKARERIPTSFLKQRSMYFEHVGLIIIKTLSLQIFVLIVLLLIWNERVELNQAGYSC